LCQRRCPSDAIIVTKPQKEWRIDRLRCVICNACVEACPVKCLRTVNVYSPSVFLRDEAVTVMCQPPAPEGREADQAARGEGE
jgi:formate hydrogenlyase subunit 6/NADH:ubiquinone oxidoreductase subunit I